MAGSSSLGLLSVVNSLCNSKTRVAVSHPPPISFSSVKNTSHLLYYTKNLKLCVYREDSAHGIPTEVDDEDSKFVPLNPQDPQFGPPALLFLGFQLDEVSKVQQLLKDLDGDFMEIKLCTEEMITLSLWDAVNTRQPDLTRVKIAKSLPRICFLSGLTGEEMMMFIDAFPDSGLEPPVFAALVPNSADKLIQELIEEVMGDHEMLTGSASS